MSLYVPVQDWNSIVIVCREIGIDIELLSSTAFVAFLSSRLYARSHAVPGKASVASSCTTSKRPSNPRVDHPHSSPVVELGGVLEQCAFISNKKLV